MCNDQGDELESVELRSDWCPGWVGKFEVEGGVGEAAWERAFGVLFRADGVPCGHGGCLSHVTHRCEGCGWGAGRLTVPSNTVQYDFRELPKDITLVVEFHETWEWKVRQWVAVKLIWLATWVLGCGVEVGGSDADCSE